MDFDALVKIKVISIKRKTIKITPKTFLYCKFPYKNNKNGCPNYNKCDLCPPNTTLINLDKFNYFYLVYAKFDYFRYWLYRLFEAIKTDNLKFWTTQRLNSLLYWQSSIKKKLKDKIKEIKLLQCV